MEQIINKYHNAKIYKITSANTDKIYIGSTTMTLDMRLRSHSYNCKRWINKTLNRYTRSFDIIKMNNYKIELIEIYKCENKKELELREQYYIKLNKDVVVNKTIPRRTKIEYYQDNIDKIKIYRKKYIEDNKDKLNEYAKHYRQDKRTTETSKLNVNVELIQMI